MRTSTSTGYWTFGGGQQQNDQPMYNNFGLARRLALQQKKLNNIISILENDVALVMPLFYADGDFLHLVSLCHCFPLINGVAE